MAESGRVGKGEAYPSCSTSTSRLHHDSFPTTTEEERVLMLGRGGSRPLSCFLRNSCELSLGFVIGWRSQSGIFCGANGALNPHQDGHDHSADILSSRPHPPLLWGAYLPHPPLLGGAPPSSKRQTPNDRRLLLGGELLISAGVNCMYTRRHRLRYSK